MTTAEFIIALFYRIDNQMSIVPKHPQAALYPSETVPLGVLYALRAGAGRRRTVISLFHDDPVVFRPGCRAHPQTTTSNVDIRWIDIK